MIRDKIKSVDYWSITLSNFESQIQQYESMLIQNIPADKRGRISRALYHKRFCYLVSLFSAGASAEDLKNAYSDCLNQMDTIWTPSSSYVEMLWMVSLGVMLNIPSNQVKVLIRIYDSYGASDSLISYLLHSMDNSIELCDSILFDDPYIILYPITRIKDHGNPGALIHEYLSKWYEGHSDTWWYNTHQTNTYIGYWCFEAAALVKILGLKEMDYYVFDQFPRFKE